MIEQSKGRSHTGARGYQHAEAFALMQYACAGTADSRRGERPQGGCGHRETIWNSRDGVTPFGTGCPSCGGDLLHVEFYRDRYAPAHRPHNGQRVWRDGTLAEWEKVYLRRLMQGERKMDRAAMERQASEYARDAVDRGEPWLEITGYADTWLDQPQKAAA